MQLWKEKLSSTEEIKLKTKAAWIGPGLALMVVITRGDNSSVLSAHHWGLEQRTAGGGEKDLNQGLCLAACVAAWWQ